MLARSGLVSLQRGAWDIPDYLTIVAADSWYA